MSWAWVIGGGVFQRPLVREFRRRGFTVRVTDRDPDCACKDIAEIFVADTYDFQSQFETALRYKKDNNPPVAIATAGTDVAHIVSGLARVFNLPACNQNAALRARNKLRMRMATNFRHPKYTWIRWHKDPTARITDPEFVMPKQPKTPPFPVAVKPTDSSASRGLYIAHDKQQLTELAVKAGKAGHGDEFVMVEEFLGGALYAPQASTDWFVWRGKVYFLNGVLRLFHDKIAGLETGYYSPWKPPKQVMRMAKKAVYRLGVDQGPFKMDLIYDVRYQWCLLECTCRWSGGLDHNYAARLALGKDFSKLLADYSTGHHRNLTEQLTEYWSWQKNEDVERICQYVPILKPGQIVGTEMLTTFQSHRGIIRAVPLQKVTPDTVHQTTRPVLIFAKGWAKGMAAAQDAVAEWQSLMAYRNARSSIHDP